MSCCHKWTNYNVWQTVICDMLTNIIAFNTVWQLAYELYILSMKTNILMPMCGTSLFSPRRPYPVWINSSSLRALTPIIWMFGREGKAHLYSIHRRSAGGRPHRMTCRWPWLTFSRAARLETLCSPALLSDLRPDSADSWCQFDWQYLFEVAAK